jgi:hypothetical protein
MPTPRSEMPTPRSEMPTPDVQTPLAPRIESGVREGDHLYARPSDYSGDNRPSLNDLNASVGEIKNYYDDLPADLAEGMNYISPTFHLHRLKMPFRMLVVAPSGTGLFSIIINRSHNTYISSLHLAVNLTPRPYRLILLISQ